jgi:hypothetical protein
VFVGGEKERESERVRERESEREKRERQQRDEGTSIELFRASAGCCGILCPDDVLGAACAGFGISLGRRLSG